MVEVSLCVKKKTKEKIEKKETEEEKDNADFFFFFLEILYRGKRGERKREKRTNKKLKVPVCLSHRVYRDSFSFFLKERTRSLPSTLWLL